MLREFFVCWNNVYRRIFGMNKWESVKLIQYFCGRLDFIRIFHLRKLQFIRRTSSLVNHSVMTECVNYYTLSKEFNDMMTLYAADCIKFSSGDIRDAVYVAFAVLCLGGT